VLDSFAFAFLICFHVAASIMHGFGKQHNNDLIKEWIREAWISWDIARESIKKDI
jgi:hypothetical protein